MKTFHYRWKWSFQSPPEKFWPLVSDTNKFNKDTGLPKVQISPSNNPDNGYLTLFFYQLGIKVEWHEYAFEWEYPSKFSVLRQYQSGPVRQMFVEVLLRQTPSGGTEMDYNVDVIPANPLGLIAIPVYIGLKSKIAFEKIFKRYDSSITLQHTPPVTGKKNELSSAAQAKLEEYKRKFLEIYTDLEIITHICDIISYGDEFVTHRLRPYELAKKWGTPKKKTLQHFLYATRIGLVDLRWDLLCPLCRGTKNSFDTLSELTGTIHCENCKIDVSANFDKLIEISFKPNSQLRDLAVNEYCVGGPQVTPHIISQQVINAGQKKEVNLVLQEGKYRIRTPQHQSGIIFESEPGSDIHEDIIHLTKETLTQNTELLSPAPKLILFNDTAETTMFIIEKLAWIDDAVTATEISSMQTFRDLFASEAIKPGLRISVGSITILFTDLKNSTIIYRTIGDATAFGFVIDHFDILKKAVDEFDGAIVKTIGDAIMAVFTSPVNAIKTVIKAKQEILKADSDLMTFKLKSGIHFGPCIAVNLNNNLDYFGSTVNITARLEGQSNGEDIIISDVIYRDPEVKSYVEENTDLIRVEDYSTTLKGFDAEEFSLRRIIPL